MCGVVKIEITESEKVLKGVLGQQKSAFGKERVQALYLLKTKQVKTVQHLAIILGRFSSNYSTLVAAIPHRWTNQPIGRTQEPGKTDEDFDLGDRLLGERAKRPRRVFQLWRGTFLGFMPN